MNLPFSIGIVDDDPAIQRAIGRLLRSEGFEVRAFSSAAEFLADKTAVELDCLILDLAMPGGSGIELQREMERLNWRIPIIFLTGEGDIPVGVKAIKAGAVDFLTKPVRDGTLFAALREALKTAHRDRRERELLRRLTEREKEILRHTISGRPNKHIGADLGISEQTVKVHRMNLNHKLGTASLVDLVRLAERHGLKAVD